MNARVALSIAAACVVGLLLWMLLGKDPATSDPSAPVETAATSSESTLPAPNAPSAMVGGVVQDAPETDASTIDLGAGDAGIEGTVFDPAGNNAPDAPVVLYRANIPQDVQDDGGTVIWQLFRGDRSASDLFDVVDRTAEVRADEQGNFAFTSLAPGKYLVAAQTENSLRTPAPELVRVTTKTERSDVNVVSGAMVHGRVLEPSGTPVPGAEVTLEGLIMRRMQTGGDGFIPIEEMLLFAINPLERDVKADDVGEFQFVGLPQLDYRISAGADPWATAEVVVNVPVDDEATLILAEAGILVGRVVDERGRGIAEAELSLSAEGGDRMRRWMDRRQPTKTTTDADGNFRIPRLRPGPYSLDVEAGGYQQVQERTQIEASAEEFLEVRLEAGGVLRGIVRGENGDPIADVEVRARSATQERGGFRGRGGRRGGGRISVETDAQGVFLFDTLATGEYRLDFRHDDWLPDEVTAQTGDPRLEVTLVQGESVTGRVVDQSGEAIADARVSVRGEGRGARPRGGRSDAQGFFRVGGFRAQTQTLSVRARGFTNWESEIAGTADLGDIVLAPAVIISGVVLDPDGAPLPGVRVRGQLAQGNADFFGGRGGRGERGGRGGRGGRDGNPMGRRVSVNDNSDADGVFVLELPEPEGEWTVTARQSGLQEATTGALTVRGNDVTDVTLQLKLGVVLSGTVTGPSGEGIKGATVRLRTGGGRGGRGMAAFFGRGGSSARTEADGTYLLSGVAPGDYTLRVTAEGFAQAEVADLALSEGIPMIQDVRLARAKELTGIVVDGSGTPIVGADLFMFGAGMNRRPAAVTSLADGSFTIPGLGDDEVQVRVSATGYSTRTIQDVIAEESPLRIELDQAYELAGIVVDAETGEPVAGARITARKNSNDEDAGNRGRAMRRFGQGRKSARTTSSGEFTLTDVDAGEWSLEVRADAYVLETVDVAVPVGDAVLNVALTAGGRIRGIILNREGDPIENVLVQVFDVVTTEEAEADAAEAVDERGRGGRRPRRQRSLARERTDAEGAFLLEGVPSGTVKVTLEHDDYLPAEIAEVEVEIGGTVADLREKLETGAQLDGRLREAGGSGVRYLRLTGGVPEVRKTQAVAVGELFHFSGLPAGSYTLRIQADRRGRDVLSEQVLELKDKQRLRLDAEVAP